jgi:phosphonatase-like hydrolase
VFPELFVFDMVGTTVRPSDAIPQAFLGAFAAIGIQLTNEQVTAVRGKSKRAAIAELLTKGGYDSAATKLQDQVYAEFQDALQSHYRGGNVHAIDGAGETFDWCQSNGAKTALTTGFDRNIVGLILNSLGWDQVVDAVVCNDDVPQGRPAPFLIEKAMVVTGVDTVGRVASVGDTVSDLEAGANAGVGWNVGVLSGAHDKARLSAVNGAIILNSVVDLQEYRW